MATNVMVRLHKMLN